MLKQRYKEAQLAYYAGKPIMSDEEFDRLENTLKRMYPNWSGFSKPGSERLTKKRKIDLPKFMPSLGKCYPHQISKWLAEHDGPYLIMDKLDGSSVLACYREGYLVGLYTRGNGTVGQDITFLAAYTSLPKTIPSGKPTYVRMEAILPKRLWHRYDGQAENPRNFVAGVLNRTLDQLDKNVLKDIDFVALGLFGTAIAPGLDVLNNLQFYTVRRDVRSRLSEDWLSARLQKTKTDGLYEADGLVIVNKRATFAYASAEHPKWVTAFKENLSEEEAPQTTVKRIVWQVSHARRWTPKIEIEPVRLDGATITYCTAHNFQWMHDRKLGKGAVVTIVRSGGVIPKITSVIKPSKVAPVPPGQYEMRGKFAYAIGNVEEATVKNIARFLTVCGVEELKSKSVQKLYDYGINTITRLVALVAVGSPKAALSEAGFGPTQSTKLAAQLVKIRQATLDQLIVGSGVFPMGVGQRRLLKIAKLYKLTDILNWRADQFMARITAIPTFGEETADILWRGLLKFKALQLDSWLEFKNPVMQVKKVGKWSGITATWTGYRDKLQEQAFVNGGGEVVNFGKHTQILFYKTSGKQSSKVDKARAMGCEVLTWEEFSRRK